MTDPGNFIGWHRANPSVRWYPICHGPSAQAVLGKLLDATSPGDRCVLPCDQDPNTTLPAITRRRF